MEKVMSDERSYENRKFPNAGGFLTGWHGIFSRRLSVIYIPQFNLYLRGYFISNNFGISLFTATPDGAVMAEGIPIR